MSVQSVALASLTATYTDSEGEDGVEDDLQENSNTPQGAAPHNAQVGQPQAFTSPKSGTSASNSPVVAPNVGGKSSNDLSNAPTLVTDVTSKVQRLVSYFDDTIVSDDEGVVQTQIDGQPFENGRPSSIMECSPSCQGEQLVSDSEVDPYGVVIPPEPSGQCPVELQEKITKLFRKMESGGLDMNKVIQQRKDFRNPSIYEKLVQFCSINELGTNYPPDRFDPFKWGKDSYYEELAKVQKAKMDKLEKARKEKTKIEIVSGTAKRPNSSSTTEDDAKKRKSKWDQVATGATASIKPTVLLSQPTLTTLTSSATGTKATKRKLQRISHKCEYNIDSHNMRSYIHIAIHVIHKIDFLNLIVGFVERYRIDLSFYILWDKLFWKYIISMTFVRMIINKDASSRQLSITYTENYAREGEKK